MITIIRVHVSELVFLQQTGYKTPKLHLETDYAIILFMSKQLTDQEQRDFQDMITACGRNPSEYSIDIIKTSGHILIRNTVSSIEKEYTRDDQAGWIISFATDLKMGDI